MAKARPTPTPTPIPLHDLITSLRIIRQFASRYRSDCGAHGTLDWYSTPGRESVAFAERLIEDAIEAHGYKKFEGKFYKLSDFQLLSPLEV